MSLVNSDATLSLTAYLIREACGLDANESVVLGAGAEVVRKMALRSQRHHDMLRKIARDTAEYISRQGKCPQADVDEDLCSYSECGYCLVASHINQLEVIRDSIRE